MICQYTGLVKYVIKRASYRPTPGIDYDDLVSAGTIGLINAIDRFDPTFAAKFETYAFPRIRGAIGDMFRSLDAVGRTARKVVRDASKISIELERRSGCPPADDEVAAALGLSLARYRKHVQKASRSTVSLDATTSITVDGRGERVRDTIADPDVDLSARIEHTELRAEIAAALSEIPEREQLILALYFTEELTLREVAKVLGVSEARIHQLKRRALDRLRETLAHLAEEYEYTARRTAA